MTKSFVVLAGIFILVGASIGGAFTGGMILGKSQAENETPAASNLVPPQGSNDQAAAMRQAMSQIPLGEDGNPDFAALRQMAQSQGRELPTPPGRTPTASMDADTDESDSGANIADAEQGGEDARTSFPGFGRGSFGPFGGGATFGAIESIGDGVVVITTPQGTVEVAIGSETAIQVFSTGALDDLKEGMTVTVTGEFDPESGKLEAASIIAAPEGAAAFPGLGGLANRGQGGRRP